MTGPWRLIVYACGLILGFGTSAHAEKYADFSVACEQAAEQAAASSGVPVSVLKAISLNETGRKSQGRFRPWAWTVNMEGKGFWFDTLDEARSYVFKEFKRGARSFDVGCFQINYKWHGHAFPSIEAMFDPVENGLYAAKFLKELYQETGSWTAAAGAYHSRTKKYAEPYSARFEKFRSRFLAEDKMPAPATVQRLARADAAQAPAPPDIPEIPDIVAANAPAPPTTRQRINTFPLFIRKQGNTARMGGAAGASLFASALDKSREAP